MRFLKVFSKIESCEEAQFGREIVFLISHPSPENRQRYCSPGKAESWIYGECEKQLKGKTRHRFDCQSRRCWTCRIEWRGMVARPTTSIKGLDQSLAPVLTTKAGQAGRISKEHKRRNRRRAREIGAMRCVTNV